MTKSQEKKYIAVVFLVLMCIQFIPIEGHGVSNVKFAAMCLTPFIWLNSFKTVSKAFVWGSIYLLAIIVSVIYNSDSFRLSTAGYKVAFVVMFIMYYDLIYSKRALTLPDFIKFLRALILAFTITLLIQQLALIIGIRSLPIINLMGYLDRGIGSNALSLEPSHAARILTVLMLALLRMYEVKWGSSNLTLSRFYKENKWVVLGFLWSMLTMGSGTAFVGLAILSFYFIQKQYAFISIGLITLFYFAIPKIDYEPFNRVKDTFEAAITLDQEKVIEADHSASARILPLLNTISYLDVNSADTWFGKGIDKNVTADYLSEEQTIGGITDYGLISFIASLIFVFACCIRKPLSLETLIFILMMGAGISNVAYVWGILMLFTTSKYFIINKRIHQQRIILKTSKLF
ncbi:hypothetical protein N9800_01055 [bacterium]|nr:hypothetical protein [bacterium]